MGLCGKGPAEAVGRFCEGTRRMAHAEAGLSKIKWDEAEALRYFRARPGDGQALAAIRSAYAALREEVQPRHTAKQFGCRVYTEAGLAEVHPELTKAGARQKQESVTPMSMRRPGGVLTESVQRHLAEQPCFVVLDNGILFYSRSLARYIGNSRGLYLFGATLGSRVDTALRRMALRGVAEAAAGQAVAASLIESYCNACCEELQGQLPPEKQLKWRFSPGYGDWSLSEQRILFPVLDCAHTIGLTLTESCMMAPVKSVTAVIGITEKNEMVISPEASENIQEEQRGMGQEAGHT